MVDTQSKCKSNKNAACQINLFISSNRDDFVQGCTDKCSFERRNAILNVADFKTKHRSNEDDLTSDKAFELLHERRVWLIHK
jgi:hypothetical protein